MDKASEEIDAEVKRRLAAKKRQAPTIGLLGLIDLADRVTFGKYDVSYRVNVSRDDWVRWTAGEGAFDDAPTPAFYYLSVAEYSEAVREKFRKEAATPRTYVYLDPLVGKLFREAGYIGRGVRARSLSRIVADLQAKANEYEEGELEEIGKAEAIRMAAEAMADARKWIRYAAVTLKNRLIRLGEVAGVTADLTGAIRIGLDQDLTALLDYLKDAKDPGEPDNDLE
jgi:hypothetical protein